jgi:hypothetical protein
MADRADPFADLSSLSRQRHKRCADRFYRLADEHNLRMGELLEQALEAFEKG